MARSAATSDPRTIVTPDAFEVSRHLLGFPLASPSRRLLAILVDLLVVGLLTTLPAILLGIVAAALFFRIWGKSEKGDPLARAFKWTMGCFGAFVLLVTLTVVGVVATGSFDGGGPNQVVEEAMEGAVGADSEGGPDEIGLGDVVRGVALGREYGRSDTREEARRLGAELARRMERAGLDRFDIRDILEEQAPEGASWDREALVDEVMASLEGGAEAGAPPDADTAAPAPDEVAAEEPAPAEPGEPAAPVFSAEAEDSFRVYESRISDLEEDREDLRDDLQDAEQDLDQAREANEGGFFSGLWSFVDELGLGFGWGSVYLTIFMVWWKGQTVGKRMLNIRVLRLDGEPIGWFVAFERAGGYAAGFATGLLGFAQIWWDPNRQAIHDKIVGTVVIKDGEDRVPGPWMAEDYE